MRKALTEQQITAFRIRLCAAAEQLFVIHGVSGVTMRQITQQLGVSQTTPYKYFADKDEIVAAVRASVFRRFCDRLEEATVGAGAAENARAVGKAYLTFALDEPDAYNLMYDIYQPHASAYPELQHELARSRKCMTLYVQALIDEGSLKGDAEELGQYFWAAAHGLIMLYTKGFIPPGDDLESLNERMIRYIWKGWLVDSVPLATKPKANKKSTQPLA